MAEEKQEFRPTSQLERANKLAEERSVKVHRFLPSGREIWTVVGREGDLLVDTAMSYCSCRHYHYMVLGEKSKTCSHLVAAELALKKDALDVILLNDEEHSTFLTLLLKDIPVSKRKSY